MADFERNYRRIIEAIRQARAAAQIVLLGVWKQQPLAATYDGIIAQLADDYGATYVSLEALGADPALSGPAGVRVYEGTSDAFHPNDAGHAAIAAAVESAIRW